jgi:hypothetical protein
MPLTEHRGFESSRDPGAPSDGLWCWMWSAICHQMNALPTTRAGMRSTVLVPLNEAAADAVKAGAPLGLLPDGRPQYRTEPVRSVRVYRLEVSPADQRRGHSWERVLQLTSGRGGSSG